MNKGSIQKIFLNQLEIKLLKSKLWKLKFVFSCKLKFINKHHLWSLVCSWTYWSSRTGCAGYLPFKWVCFSTTWSLSCQRGTLKPCRTFNTCRRSSGTDFIRITWYAGRGSTGSRVRIGFTSSTCCPPIHPSEATKKQQIHTLKLNKLILFWPCLQVSSLDLAWRSAD